MVTTQPQWKIQVIRFLQLKLHLLVDPTVPVSESKRGLFSNFRFNQAVVLAVFILILYLGIIFLIPSQSLRMVLVDILDPLLELTAAAAIFYAAVKSYSRSKRLGLAWGFIFAGLFSYAIGDVIWGVLEIILYQKPSPSLADGFFLLAYPLFMLGVFLIPFDPTARQAITKRLLDVGIVAAAATLGFWNYVLGPVYMAGMHNPWLVQALDLAYPVGDFILFWVLLMLLYRQSEDQNQGPLRLLTVGFGFTIIIQILYSYQSSLGTFQIGGILEFGLALSVIHFGLAGLLQGLKVASRESLSNPAGSVLKAKSRLQVWLHYFPYLWIILALVILADSADGRLPMTNITVAIWVGGIVAMVLARQILELNENFQLNQRLNLVLDQLKSQAKKLQDEIAERVQMQVSLTKLAAMIEFSDDAIIGKSLDGIIESWNSGAERLYGYGEDEVIGKPISILLPADHSDDLPLLLARIKLGEHIHHFETVRVAKDGRMIDVALTISPVKDSAGQIIGASTIARDISERKKIEKELLLADEKLKSWVYVLERQNKEAELLSTMGNLLQVCTRPEEAYPVIEQYGQLLFPATSGALYIISNSRRLVEVAAAWGEKMNSQRTFILDECWALLHGQVHAVDQSNLKLCCRHIQPDGIFSYLDLPMMASGETFGLLHVETPDPSLEHWGMTDLAKIMAKHLELAVANLRLRETLRTQSIRDPLTGLYNRRYMEESLEREVHRSHRRQSRVAIIMLDIDHFKNFNDTFGHTGGDAVLRGLGTLLQEHVRGEDIACRFGGEEFILILPDTPLKPAVERAELIRNLVKSMTVEYRLENLGGISVSLGVAIFPDHGQTIGEILRTVDQAMYSAKQNGRDRVEIAGVIGI